ncbi:MAG TPA: hypothetical protein VM347_10335, partial [Nonomuraea sp.]|nr:hypothetical protein [Nonomuraea sp.]
TRPGHSPMTGLVGRAEERGLVRRSSFAHDGRAVFVDPQPDDPVSLARLSDRLTATPACIGWRPPRSPPLGDEHRPTGAEGDGQCGAPRASPVH